MIYPGFSTRLLSQGPNGEKAPIFEIAPGAVYTEVDIHSLRPEDIFVVSIAFSDNKNNYSAGSFIHNPVGSLYIHQSQDGCAVCLFSAGIVLQLSVNVWSGEGIKLQFDANAYLQ